MRPGPGRSVADRWISFVPSPGIDQIVLEGARGLMLAFGPERLESYTPPIEGRTMIHTGHRDTHFRFLKKSSGRRDNPVTSSNRTMASYYGITVRDRQIVDSRTASIPTHEDKTLLTLITCYPFDAIAQGGPLGYMVIAEMVERKAGNP